MPYYCVTHALKRARYCIMRMRSINISTQGNKDYCNRKLTYNYRPYIVDN